MSQSASVQYLWIDDRFRWSVQSVEAWTKPNITFDTSILIFSIAAVSSSGLIKGGLSCLLALLTEADARFAELLSYKGKSLAKISRKHVSQKPVGLRGSSDNLLWISNFFRPSIVFCQPLPHLIHGTRHS